MAWGGPVSETAQYNITTQFMALTHILHRVIHAACIDRDLLRRPMATALQIEISFAVLSGRNTAITSDTPNAKTEWSRAVLEIYKTLHKISAHQPGRPETEPPKRVRQVIRYCFSRTQQKINTRSACTPCLICYDQVRSPTAQARPPKQTAKRFQKLAFNVTLSKPGLDVAKHISTSHTLTAHTEIYM